MNPSKQIPVCLVRGSISTYIIPVLRNALTPFKTSMNSLTSLKSFGQARQSLPSPPPNGSAAKAPIKQRLQQMQEPSCSWTEQLVVEQRGKR